MVVDLFSKPFDLPTGISFHCSVQIEMIYVIQNIFEEYFLYEHTVVKL